MPERNQSKMSEKHCECGCGTLLTGRRSKRFVDRAHKARARRARKADAPLVESVLRRDDERAEPDEEARRRHWLLWGDDSPWWSDSSGGGE